MSSASSALRGPFAPTARWRAAALTAVLCALGCSEDDGAAETEPAATTESTDETGEPAPRTCIAPPGLGQPDSIEAAVELINALPKPTSVACYVESLDRPLGITVTTSDASAQPATGAASPRFFITRGALVTSVVGDGQGRDLLEFGLDVGDRLSIKAELLFPVEAPLDAAAPYERVNFGNGTGCAVCHAREERRGEISGIGIYASEVLQHPPDESVSVSFAKQLAKDCDAEASPQRCALHAALFDHGPVDTRLLRGDAVVCHGF